MDSKSLEILARFEARVEQVADEIAACTVAEVDGFGPINDADLFAEIRTLARRHMDAFLQTARDGGAPAPEVVAAARERAVMRAREMVPLAALLHSYLIAQRVITATIASEAGPDARSRGAALALISRTFDYNIAVTSAMCDAYVEFVQGDLAELDSARRSLIDALLSSHAGTLPALTRRAVGLGFDPERTYVVAVAAIDGPEPAQSGESLPGRVRQIVARSTGRPERQAFVVSRDRVLIALLDLSGSVSPRAVLQQAQTTVKQFQGWVLVAGVGTPFRGLAGFSVSYQEARRALEYTDERRQLVFWPQDVPLFDELTASSSDEAARLIPDSTRRVLTDSALRGTLEAFVAADMRVAAAASALSLHPNTVRYRLSRIGELTGCDPRRLTDVVELIAAARVIAAKTRRTRANGPVDQT